MRSASGRLTPLISCLLTTNSGDNLRRVLGNGVDRDRSFQLVQEAAPAVAKLGRFGSINPIADFGDGHRGQNNLRFSDSVLYILDGFPRGHLAALGGHKLAGNEDSFQDSAVHCWRSGLI